MIFNNVYKGKKVLVTGHTGFKGSWLCKWLEMMGADVVGFSLEPSTKPNHFNNINIKMNSVIGNIKNYNKLNRIFKEHKPELIFHLAAQPSVLESYDNPLETFNSNVIGTVNVLDICRLHKFVKGIVVITTDKCYKNNEWIYPYREIDELGGIDPYSSSKACSELVISSYRESFLKKKNIIVASARAGNVIGGGDWVADRLVPDAVRAANSKKVLLLRNPESKRPWQHVLEPLSGYLLLGQKIIERDNKVSQAWNFGPTNDSNLSTKDLIKLMNKHWELIISQNSENPTAPHEASLLMLDSSKATNLLKWSPVWDINETINQTVGWYKSFYNDNEIITEKQIEIFIYNASQKGLKWTNQ